METTDRMKKLQARSMNNCGVLLNSRECGCYFCLKLYDPALITDWVNEETARCPFCGVESVLPESDEYELTNQLLLSMKEYPMRV